MGIVYEAADLDNGRRVALKTSMRALRERDHRDRWFLREGRLAASVSHPNTVYVFGTEEIDGIPGHRDRSWRRRHAAASGSPRHGPLAPAKAVDAILQVVAGLAAARGSRRVCTATSSRRTATSTPRLASKVGDFGLSISTLTRGRDRSLTRSGRDTRHTRLRVARAAPR